MIVLNGLFLVTYKKKKEKNEQDNFKETTSSPPSCADCLKLVCPQPLFVFFLAIKWESTKQAHKSERGLQIDRDPCFACAVATNLNKTEGLWTV